MDSHPSPPSEQRDAFNVLREPDSSQPSTLGRRHPRRHLHAGSIKYGSSKLLYLLLLHLVCRSWKFGPRHDNRDLPFGRDRLGFDLRTPRGKYARPGYVDWELLLRLDIPHRRLIPLHLLLLHLVCERRQLRRGHDHRFLHSHGEGLGLRLRDQRSLHSQPVVFNGRLLRGVYDTLGYLVHTWRQVIRDRERRDV